MNKKNSGVPEEKMRNLNCRLNPDLSLARTERKKYRNRKRKSLTPAAAGMAVLSENTKIPLRGTSIRSLLLDLPCLWIKDILVVALVCWHILFSYLLCVSLHLSLQDTTSDNGANKSGLSPLWSISFLSSGQSWNI